MERRLHHTLRATRRYLRGLSEKTRSAQLAAGSQPIPQDDGASGELAPGRMPGAEAGVPVPGLMVSLGYFDAYRSAWLPANLIQAQRDYFGAHTYERIDAKGTFHMEWQKP